MSFCVDHLSRRVKRGFVWQTQYFLRRFQKMRCIFRVRRNTLDTADVILRGKRSTLDVWRVACFCESHCQRCAKWRHGANSVAGMAFCDMS